MPSFQQSLYNQIVQRTNPSSGTGPSTPQYGPNQSSDSILGAGSTRDSQQISNEANARAQREAAEEAKRQDDINKLQLQKAQADYEIAAAKAREATSPEAQAAAELAVQKAKLDITYTTLNIAKLSNQMPPQDVAKLENQLALERDALKQQFDAQMQDARIANEWSQVQYTQDAATERTRIEIDARRQEGALDRGVRVSEGALDRQANSTEKGLDRSLTSSENALTRQATSQENELDRTARAQENRLDREARLNETKLQAGVQLRGQELDRLQALDTFATNTVANQIRKGELDVDRGYKVFQSALQAHRLPAEITADIGQALAPFVPHLSSYKPGEIPLGFESGGPFETAMRQGGATSYDPSAYAAKPVGVDLFGIAKKFGATPPKGGIPDPNKIIPKVPDIQMPTSALASLQMPADIESNIRNYLGNVQLPAVQ